MDTGNAKKVSSKDYTFLLLGGGDGEGEEERVGLMSTWTGLKLLEMKLGCHADIGIMRQSVCQRLEDGVIHRGDG